MAQAYDFKIIASTLRENNSASDNKWSAMLYDGNDYYYSKKYNMHIVDRIGGGDAFTAGLIYALINEHPLQESIEFAAAAGCLKHSIVGDYNQVTVTEVQALADGDGSGRVLR